MAPVKHTKSVPKKPRKKPVTKTVRAGLQFPVGRLQRHLRIGRYANRIRTDAAVYMTSVLEYLSAEILEIAGMGAKANKKVRINPRHIMGGIAQDAELSELLKDVTIPYAGVIPFIHEILLPKNSKKYPTKQSGLNNIQGEEHESMDESRDEEDSQEDDDEEEAAEKLDTYEEEDSNVEEEIAKKHDDDEENSQEDEDDEDNFQEVEDDENNSEIEGDEEITGIISETSVEI